LKRYLTVSERCWFVTTLVELQELCKHDWEARIFGDIEAPAPPGAKLGEVVFEVGEAGRLTTAVSWREE